MRSLQIIDLCRSLCTIYNYYGEEIVINIFNALLKNKDNQIIHWVVKVLTLL